MGMPLSLQSPS